MAPKVPGKALESLSKRVENLETSLSGQPLHKLSWFWSLDWPGRFTVVGFPVAIIALLIALFAWLQPQWKAEADDTVSHKIDDRIEAKLQQHHFDDLASKVNNMEGQLNEISGYLKLLTARDLAQTASLSKDEFRRHLHQIQKTLQAATIAEATVPTGTTQSIQNKLLSISDKEPVFWGTASALADYTSALRSSFAASKDVDCYGTFSVYDPHPVALNSRRNVMMVHSCTLVIDDVKGFDQSGFGQHFRAEVAQGVTDILVLDLVDVHIIYRGGEPIPFSAIGCQNCTYSFVAPSDPPSRGQALIRAALVASNGNLEISSGM